MLPLWQAEFGLDYAALGVLRGVFVGAMASLQIPAGFASEKLGAALVLGLGTALAGLGYCLAGLSSGFALLLGPVFIGGLGATTQHPIGSALFAGGADGKVACAFIGARIGAIGTVWLTEGLTAIGILALMPLPLHAALVLLPLIGVALNGTSSVLYGSVPSLVVPQRRTRALSIFYTGTIGSGALAPPPFRRRGIPFGAGRALPRAPAWGC